MPSFGLATTVHDPEDALAQRLHALLPALAERFAHVSVVATVDTGPGVVAALRTLASYEAVPTDVQQAGAHRRRALALALQHPDERILYADLDHLLRWIERGDGELDACLVTAPEADLVVFGRSEAAFAASPERLRRTESIVNAFYALTTGDAWDVLMAVRLFTRPAAEAVVREASESSLAADIEWPMLLRRLGHSLAYIPAAGLVYETNSTYGTGTMDVDDLDIDAWIFRMALATRHLEVMRDEAERSAAGLTPSPLEGEGRGEG